jgi:hypothetical protein
MPVPLPAGHDPISRQTGGWRDLADAVEAARRRTGAAFVAADQYGVAAELAHALPRDVPVIAVGPRWASFDLPPAAVAGAVGLLIQPESHAASIWLASAALGSLVRHRRDGAVIAAYRLYRVVPDRSTSAVQLPRPAAP